MDFFSSGYQCQDALHYHRPDLLMAQVSPAAQTYWIGERVRNAFKSFTQ